MKNIKMVDLKGQYLKIKEEIDTSIQDVIDSTQFIKGSEVTNFQEDLSKYLSVNNVVACGNGTDALQIALMSLGLEIGDEVITTNFTFAATVEVIGLLHLKPVLIDVYRDTFSMNIEELEKAITPKTKAIIPVHLYGQCVDMEKILSIAKKYNLFVIEDTAQAIGAEYTFRDGTVKKAGTMGDVGTTSFFPSKNLGCYGDGGALFTNNNELATRLRAIVNHGMYKRYYHEEIGVNSRLDTIQAAVLRKKLPYLDSYNKARYNAALYYNEGFKNEKKIETPVIAEYSNHVFHQYTLKLDKGINRDELQDYLKNKGVPSMVYYPLALHNQKAYKQDGVYDEQFPVTMELCGCVISLPMHTELKKEEQDYIIKTVKEFINR